MNNIENINIVVALLKNHNIRYIVTSPGGTNIALVSALQNDSFFKCFSVVDERSAMYFAIGLYLQTGESIAMSCTSAQATRNYIPGLTEAYYKQVPILAITMSKLPRFTYQSYMQAPNQISLPVDCVKKSYTLPIVQGTSDYLESCRVSNEAILELTHNGKGPVQLNIPWQDFEISPVDRHIQKTIKRYTSFNEQDKLKGKKIMIVAGEHRPYDKETLEAINAFCRTHDCVIYTNHLSNLHTEYAINGNLFLSTNPSDDELKNLLPNILISIGGQTGDYPFYLTFSKTQYLFEHWSINESGNVVDTYDKLTVIYQMDVKDFFLSAVSSPSSHMFLDLWRKKVSGYVYTLDLPLSNTYVAAALHDKLPKNSTVNFAILNSLRNWNLFPMDASIKCFANVAAFGIDGCTSMLIGESVLSDELHFLITGDLAFFYDLNSLGIRHIKNNVRILIINNNGGVEFKMAGNADQNKKTDLFIAAANHFKNAKGWAETCGFTYISAFSHDEFKVHCMEFLEKSSQPIVFEVFAKDIDEAVAYRKVLDYNKKKDAKYYIKAGIRKIKKQING